jgi:hypothetical protein
MFALTKDRVQEMLAGRLVAQRSDVNRRAARAKRTPIKRCEDSSFDRT